MAEIGVLLILPTLKENQASFRYSIPPFALEYRGRGAIFVGRTGDLDILIDPHRESRVEYAIRAEEDKAVVDLKGDLMFTDHPTVTSMLNELARRAVPQWHFNLAELRTIDSAGIGMMLIAKNESEKASAQLQLHEPNDAVRKVLDLTRIGDMIPIV